MRKSPVRGTFRWCSLLIALVCALPLSPAFGGGFGGGGFPWDPSCTPDENLVITPGPFGSPLRIVSHLPGQYLIADYARNSIYQIDENDQLSRLIETDGKPLSIAVRPAEEPTRRFFRRSRSAELYYFVGNDDERTVDIYREARGNFNLRRKLFRRGEGVQALDMVYNKEIGKLFIVDGLSQTIKVLNPLRNWDRVRTIGKGFLTNPKGMAIDTATREIFVTDYGDIKLKNAATVKVFDFYGNLLRTISGRDAGFARPQGITLSSNKVYVVDAMVSKVFELNRSNGSLSETFGCMGSSEGHMLLPMDVTLDAAGDNLHVADNRNMRITILPLNESP